MDPLYLDWNASAPLSEAARAAMIPALSAANPHSPHAPGRRAAALLDQARTQVATRLGRDARHVVFTSGATEANTWALQGSRTFGRPLVVTSAVEHPSVLRHADRIVGVDNQGRVDLAALEAILALERTQIAVVSVQAANHETGVIQPMAEVERLCRQAGVPWHCDAAQLFGRLDLPLQADLLTLSAHKMGGPVGVGALVGAALPPPLLRGGPQERGHRAGTSAVALAVGFGAAVAAAQTWSSAGRDALEAACLAAGGEVLGGGTPRLPNTLLVLFPWPGDLLVIALDLEGVAVSTGAACASGASEESAVLLAMGRKGRPVRFSLGPDTPVEAAIAALERVVERFAASG
jgi:cysteine desulfurase